MHNHDVMYRKSFVTCDTASGDEQSAIAPCAKYSGTGIAGDMNLGASSKKKKVRGEVSSP